MENPERNLTDRDVIRERVRGNNGPRRHEVVTFKKISDVPSSVIDEIRKIALNYQGNDLVDSRHPISVNSKIAQSFKSERGYKQILLQKHTGDESIEESQYTEWFDDLETKEIQKFLTETFGKVFRARISITPPGEELPWHIDTDTSKMCRIQICVQDKESYFEFNVRGTETSNRMKEGELYFINTGWTHRIRNVSDSDRIVLLAGVYFNDVPDSESFKV